MIQLCCEYLSVRYIWLYVLIMSRTSLKVNPHSTVAWMPRNSLLERDAISEDEVTANGLEPRTTYFLNEHSTIWPNWPNDWAVPWVLICTVHLNVCCYHVTYEFESESTLYSCVNVKEPLARRRHHIWRLSDCNGTRNHNHLVRKRTLNHLAKLAKWLSCVVSTFLYGEFDCMFLSCHVRFPKWIHTLQLPECQGTPCSKQVPYLKIKWLQRDSNPQPLSSLTNTQPFGQTGQIIELCCEYLAVRCIWLYVFIMSRTSLRVNPHSTVAWMSTNSLLEGHAISED